ncbi:hypothetical protein L0668_20070 [Paraglaciecola aquimarina]|uniref:Uncharacterized protein n=1 Tax=Paraglaciecola algarum TaxID=3050085 RepID=A0ABS9DDJ0_9ALTE|nr:hypothetical protein [Paraglaciecola sp. G1-23]MCF2950417.1 hypothetical protein [Paraglaciecola sp. G1-23]
MSHILIKYRNYLLGVFIGVAMLFLYLFETIHNGGFYESTKTLFIPVGIMIFAFFKVNLYKLRTLFWPDNKWKPWLYCVMVYLVTMLMVWPYYVATNVLLSSNKSQLISGDILKKFKSGSKSTSFNVTVKDELTLVEYDLTVGENKFEQLEIGANYSECFHVGGFGILYRWRNVPLTSCSSGTKNSLLFRSSTL